MIIAVDAGALGVKNKKLQTGVFYYSYYLLKNLCELDTKNSYILYSFEKIDKKILDEFGPNVTNLVLKSKLGFLNVRVSLEIIKRKPDIFLGLNQALPFFHPKKSIVVFHDLAFELFPKLYEKGRLRLSLLSKYAAKKAWKIVAVSKSTKNDLTNIYRVNEKKIEIIKHAVDKSILKKAQKWKTIKKKFQLKAPYILFVGSLKPGKNIPCIIEAFNKFLENVKEKYTLVLAGSDYWFDKRIKEKIQQLKMQKKVKILGFVDRTDLFALYSNAQVFVSPSFYEGFGLPLIEAFACNVPVITSNTSSMKELAKDAAILVNPNSSKEITEALMTLFRNNKIRNALIKKGQEKITQYSWKSSARQMLDLMEKS